MAEADEVENCAYCDVALKGVKYVQRQNELLCIGCFEQNFADKCYECNQPIGADFKDLRYKGRTWHQECFKCWACQGSLADQEFICKEEGLYCPPCYDKNFAKKCDKCGITFKHGADKFEYSGKKYHVECFTCAICNEVVGNNNFVPREGDTILCMPCYNQHYAKRCGKCEEVLIHHGVTFREEAFHKECFVCSKCDAPIAHTRFTTYENKPFCSDCYNKHLTKICSKCGEAISGLGSPVKYVTFDGKNWHADCFLCNTCDKSLLGEGFLSIDENVFCPDCSLTL